MTLRTPPSWLQNGSHPAENDRLTTQALYATTGIIGSSSLAVAQNATPNMSVNIAAGWAAIVGTSTTTQGTYVSYNDAVVNAAIATAPSSNSRIDLVCLTVNDAYYSGSTNNVVVNVVTGTVAASPVAPSTPANSIALAQVLVGTSVTSIVNANITDVRVNTTTNLPVVYLTGTQTLTNKTLTNPIISAISNTGLISLPTATDTLVGRATTDTLTNKDLTDSTNKFNWPSVAGKNAIINGGMEIAQRGSVTLSSATGYTLDRWSVYSPGGTFTQDSTTVPSGFRYSLKNVTSASGIWYTTQIIETSNAISFAGQIVTFSAYISTSTTTSIQLALGYSTTIDNTIALGSWTYITALSGGSGTSISGSFTRITGTYLVPAGAKTIIATINPASSMASGVSVWLTGVQIELGSTATTFSRAGGSIGGELALCQRYYWRQNWDAQTTYAIFGQGSATSTTTAYCQTPYPVQMRVKPTAIDFPAVGTYFQCSDAAAGGATMTALSFDANQTTSSMGFLSATVAAGLTQYRPYVIRGLNSTAAYLGWSAEL